MTEVTCNGLIQCLWQFQTLVAGIAAIIAALITAFFIYRSARLPVEAEGRRIAENNRRRLKFCSLQASEEFKTLCRRTRQGQGTVTVHKASNASITEDTRQKMMLRMPPATRDWDFMSLVQESLARRCVELQGLIEDHNFDMQRAGGAFGDDNFGRSIIGRLEQIRKVAGELGQLFLREAQTTPTNE